MCADFRASFHLDREHEAADRAAGRRIACPALIVTGEDEAQLADAADVWRAWTDDLTAAQVPGGHFNPEEAPRELYDILAKFLGLSAVPPGDRDLAQAKSSCSSTGPSARA
jgi:haloacetate dehalogenase